MEEYGSALLIFTESLVFPKPQEGRQKAHEGAMPPVERRMHAAVQSGRGNRKDVQFVSKSDAGVEK